MTHAKMTLLLAQAPSVSPGVSHPRFLIPVRQSRRLPAIHRFQKS
jgi:hypothetical protein